MKKALLAALSLVLAFSLTSCDSIGIGEVEPSQEVSSEVALNSLEGFESLLTSMYDRLQDVDRYGQTYVLYPDALADNITATPVNSNRYTGPVNNATGDHMNAWANPYDAINDANNVITKIDALEIDAPDPDAIKNRIKGEAFFLRALNYFDLVRTKAYEPGQEVDGFSEGVIIRTEPTETIDDADFRARSSNEEVYALIESDLQQATELLVDSGNSKFLATEAAAHALLARVYLYQRQWAEAEAEATAALDATGVTLVMDTGGDEYLNAWLAQTHPESIFELSMTQSQDGESTSANGALDALTTPGQFSFEVIPTQDLIGTHEEDDARSDLYAEGPKANDIVTYIQKYTGTTAENVDHIPIIRISEVYLTRAEARAEQGNASGAQEDLNTLRNARNLESITPSGGALIEAILRERRVELAFEGHRFFDLKRRARDIPKPQSIGVLPYTDFRILAPLPANEVDNNPMLMQNPGYN